MFKVDLFKLRLLGSYLAKQESRYARSKLLGTCTEAHQSVNGNLFGICPRKHCEATVNANGISKFALREGSANTTTRWPVMKNPSKSEG